MLIAVVALAFSTNAVTAQLKEPELIKTSRLVGQPTAIEIVGDNVYVAHENPTGDPQIVRIYLGDPNRPKFEEHFNVPIDMKAQFTDLIVKSGRIYAVNNDGLWMSNNHYELDHILVLEGAHAIGDFGDELIAVIGTHRLVFLDTTRSNTIMWEMPNPTPLTALAVGPEHRAFVADSFNGGSVRSFRLMRPDEGWAGVMNEGGASRLGKVSSLVRVGEQLWAAGPESFYYLNLSPMPTIKNERVSAFLKRMISSESFVVEIYDDWLHVINVGNGEVNNGYGQLVATLMSIQDPIVDAQTLGENHLVVAHQRNELEIYRFGDDQEPTPTATPEPEDTPGPPPRLTPERTDPMPIYLPAVLKRHHIVVYNCTGGSDDPPACAIRTPEPIPTIRPTRVVPTPRIGATSSAPTPRHRETEEPRVPPTIQP